MTHSHANALGFGNVLEDELTDKEFRDAFVGETVRTGVAFQIKALREQRGLSQRELGALAGKTQSVISKLENPDGGGVTIQSLLEISSALDIALVVRFASFEAFSVIYGDVRPQALYVNGYQRASNKAQVTAGQLSPLTSHFASTDPQSIGAQITISGATFIDIRGYIEGDHQLDIRVDTSSSARALRIAGEGSAR